MKKKNKFFGKYYKFVSSDGYSFALIISYANEGDMIQLITRDKSYYIDDSSSVMIKDSLVSIAINQDDISISGNILLGELHPLKKQVMGPFEYLPIECKHSIYSMYHSLKGSINVNGVIHSFDGGYGYIEGDRGTSFPSEYIWYNSINIDLGVTIAIGRIPFGLINFIGILCFIKVKDKEYSLCTYNFAKLVKVSNDTIVVKKGKYKFILSYSNIDGHLLKAPVKGDMSRYIKENLSVPTKWSLMYKDKVIYEHSDELSSLEVMWNI